MSEGESFLARWSRLKRRQLNESQPNEPSSLGAGVADPADAAGKSAVSEVVPLDLSNLPPIESLGANSDVSVFLSEGIPPELMQMALRAAWRADPSIRSFIEMADNQWDFNAPDAMPGFGSLGVADEAKALVARALGTAQDIAATAPLLKPGDGPTSTDTLVSAPLSDDSRVVDPVWSAGPTSTSEMQSPIDKASQDPPSSEPPVLGRRVHGSALPK